MFTLEYGNVVQLIKATGVKEINLQVSLNPLSFTEKEGKKVYDVGEFLAPFSLYKTERNGKEVELLKTELVDESENTRAFVSFWTDEYKDEQGKALPFILLEEEAEKVYSANPQAAISFDPEFQLFEKKEEEEPSEVNIAITGDSRYLSAFDIGQCTIEELNKLRKGDMIHLTLTVLSRDGNNIIFQNIKPTLAVNEIVANVFAIEKGQETIAMIERETEIKKVADDLKNQYPPEFLAQLTEYLGKAQ